MCFSCDSGRCTLRPIWQYWHLPDGLGIDLFHQSFSPNAKPQPANPNDALPSANHRRGRPTVPKSRTHGHDAVSVPLKIDPRAQNALKYDPSFCRIIINLAKQGQFRDPQAQLAVALGHCKRVVCSTSTVNGCFLAALLSLLAQTR